MGFPSKINRNHQPPSNSPLKHCCATCKSSWASPSSLSAWLEQRYAPASRSSRPPIPAQAPLRLLWSTGSGLRQAAPAQLEIRPALEHPRRALLRPAQIGVSKLREPRRTHALEGGQVYLQQGLHAVLGALGPQALSWKETAELFRASWDAVARSVEWVVFWGFADRSLEGVSALGVDELHWGRGKKSSNFATWIYQLDAGSRRLLWWVRSALRKACAMCYHDLSRMNSKSRLSDNAISSLARRRKDLKPLSSGRLYTASR